MATFVVCTRCGKTKEIPVADQFPKGWKQAGGELRCSSCADTDVLDPDAASDVLDEEVIYPGRDVDTVDETFDEDHYEACEICRGPCQGH